MKEKLTELEIQIDKSTITVRDFNIPLSAVDESIYKIKSTEDLNNTINQKSPNSWRIKQHTSR